MPMTMDVKKMARIIFPVSVTTFNLNQEVKIKDNFCN